MRKIPDDQQKLAAMYFTISNMGQPTPKHLNRIGFVYHQLSEMMEAETGESADAEFKLWLKDAKAGQKYMTDEWIDKIYPMLTADWAIEVKE